MKSAEEMYPKPMPYFKDADIAILSAAVADYRPKNVATQKIKKKEATVEIDLENDKRHFSFFRRN